MPDAADEWPFHVDHIVARQHGGADDLDNLCWSCSRCNMYKGTNLTTVDAASSTPVTLFHPRTQPWNDHFVLEDSRIVGLTVQGRATVRLLGLNHSSRIELRQRLAENGEL